MTRPRKIKKKKKRGRVTRFIKKDILEKKPKHRAKRRLTHKQMSAILRKRARGKPRRKKISEPPVYDVPRAKIVLTVEPGSMRDATDIHIEYAERILVLDLDDVDEMEIAGKRSAKSLLKHESRSWGADTFTRQNGNYRDNYTGKFVTRATVARAIGQHAYQERLQMVKNKHGISHKEAQRLYRENPAEFELLTEWREDISPPINH